MQEKEFHSLEQWVTHESMVGHYVFTVAWTD